MMRFSVCLGLLLHPRSAWGSYGQTARCLTVRDNASRVLVTEFLRNASSCPTTDDRHGVLKCAEKMMPPSTMTMLLPMINTVRRWEAHFRMDLDTAFSTVGRDADAEALVAQGGLGSGHDGTNAWTTLRRNWESEGRLCYYTNSPELADHLDPWAAGLLTLFFSDPVGTRPPILKKPRGRWRHTGALVCSAGAVREGISQARAVSDMALKAGARSGRKTGRDQDAVMQYCETFSTDPFLQAVISGLKKGMFYCPGDLHCYGTVHRGTVHIPDNNKAFLYVLAEKLQQREKVCVIFRDRLLSPDRFYIAATSIAAQ